MWSTLSIFLFVWGGVQCINTGRQDGKSGLHAGPSVHRCRSTSEATMRGCHLTHTTPSFTRTQLLPPHLGVIPSEGKVWPTGRDPPPPVMSSVCNNRDAEICFVLENCFLLTSATWASLAALISSWLTALWWFLDYKVELNSWTAACSQDFPSKTVVDPLYFALCEHVARSKYFTRLQNSFLSPILFLFWSILFDLLSFSVFGSCEVFLWLPPCRRSCGC